MSYEPPPGRQPAYEELPPRIVTTNQLVAFNITYWRQMKGMTQEELGTMLETFTGRPWSKATVSAAERSWDGKRIRQFDADELIALCEALEVPLAGLFLPPTDDGVECKYGVVTAAGPGYSAYSVRDLLNFIVSEVSADETGTVAEFGERLDSAIRFHFGDGSTGDQSTRRRLDWTDEDRIQLRLADLRTQRDVLRSVMGEVEREYAELGERLPGTRTDKPVGERRTEELGGLARQIEDAVRRPEEAVMLTKLFHLAFEVPDELDRQAAGTLMEKLLTELGQVKSSGHQSTIDELARLTAETAERAADYRTPWYRLINYIRDRLHAVDKEFAGRMAERIRAGEAPADVAEDVGLEVWSLRQKIGLAQITLPGVEWPPGPWE